MINQDGLPVDEMGNTITESPEKIKKAFLITEHDLVILKQTVKPIVESFLEEMVEGFYSWLREREEFGKYFHGNENLVANVKKKQMEYWVQMLSGKLDDEFVSNRMNLAKVHARIKLPLDVYFAGQTYFNSHVIKGINEDLIKKTQANPKGAAEQAKIASEAIQAFTKLMQIDQAIVVNEYVSMTQSTLRKQAETINELATPISVLSDGIILVPIIGVIDSNRAQIIMETMLQKILESNTKVAILDISGVSGVDSAVANHFIKITQATKLMGCTCIVSGVSPFIAQTLVHLGVELNDMMTQSSLKDALNAGFEIIYQNDKDAVSIAKKVRK